MGLTVTFCNYLRNQYHFTYDVIKPCCWIKDTKVDIRDNNIKTISASWAQISDWTPSCEYCHKLELNGAESPRTSAFKEDIFDYDSDPRSPIKLEVQIDDTCNAACLMCGSWNSSTWQQYVVNTMKDKVILNLRETSINDRIDAIKSTIDFNKVKQIHFFGGEPFKTDTHLRVLREVQRPNDTNLLYVTNGSIFPNKEIIDLLSSFKSVTIAISIDGINEHFNYLRWPLQWNKIEDNLLEYSKLSPSVFNIQVSFIATPFNMYYQDRYTEWAVGFFKNSHINGSTWFLNPNPVDGIINLSCVPPNLQHAIRQKYGESRIVKLIEPFDIKKYKNFIRYVHYHDRFRNLNWRETFPEIVPFFENINNVSAGFD